MFGNPYYQTPVYNPNPVGAQGTPTNPFMQYFANIFQQNQQPWDVPTVKGHEGAEKFEMPPRSKVLLMDEDEQIVWLVKTDDAGVKSLIQPLPFSIPEDPEKQRMSSIEDRLSKLEEEMKRRVQPDYVDVTFTE